MKDSSGNILFLILIAVALFAALTYAVTKTTSGVGDGGRREISQTNSAVLTQYADTIRGAVARMTVGTVSVTQLEFNPPSDFSNLTSPQAGVFHSSGGDVVYQKALQSVMDPDGDNFQGQWVFTLDLEVTNVGTSVSGSLDGNDLLAVLVGVKQEVCAQINLKSGIPITPFPLEDFMGYSSDLVTDGAHYKDNNYVLPSSELVIGGSGVDDEMLSGRHEGCYWEDEGDNYVYYSVILAR